MYFFFIEFEPLCQKSWGDTSSPVLLGLTLDLTNGIFESGKIGLSAS